MPLGLTQLVTYPQKTESAAGGTVYSVGMQVVDKQNKPVHASDITCKAWLVQQIPNDQILKIDTNILKNVNNLNQPITGTVNNTPVPEINGLIFDPTTPQISFCNQNGQMTWKYTIAPTVTSGTYDIVILADWKGVHWMWVWIPINVTA